MENINSDNNTNQTVQEVKPIEPTKVDGIEVLTREEYINKIDLFLLNSRSNKANKIAELQELIASNWTNTNMGVTEKIKATIELQSQIDALNSINTIETIRGQEIHIAFNPLLNCFVRLKGLSTSKSNSANIPSQYKAGDILVLTCGSTVYDNIKVTPAGMLEYNGKLYKASKLHLDAYIEEKRKSEPLFEYKGKGLQGLSSSNFKIKN